MVHARPMAVLAQPNETLWLNSAAIQLVDEIAELSISDGRLSISEAAHHGELLHFLASIEDEVTSWVYVRDDAAAVLFQGRRFEAAGSAFVGLAFHRTDSDFRMQWGDFGRVFRLSRSENRVILALLDGQDAETAAASLGMTVGTVRSHIRNAYLKIGVANREQLFRAIAPYRLT